MFSGKLESLCTSEDPKLGVLETSHHQSSRISNMETCDNKLATLKPCQTRLPGIQRLSSIEERITSFEQGLPSMERCHDRLPNMESCQDRLPSMESCQDRLPSMESCQESLPSLESCHERLTSLNPHNIGMGYVKISFNVIISHMISLLVKNHYC